MFGCDGVGVTGFKVGVTGVGVCVDPVVAAEHAVRASAMKPRKSAKRVTMYLQIRYLCPLDAMGSLCLTLVAGGAYTRTLDKKAKGMYNICKRFHPAYRMLA
jgi:hypothetical protein